MSTLCGVLSISLAHRKPSQKCTVLIPLTISFGTYQDHLFASHVRDYYKSICSLVSVTLTLRYSRSQQYQNEEVTTKN